MTKHLLSFFTIVLASFSASGADASWPQFRGPNGSGVSESAKPPKEFGPGTNQLWKVTTPSGMSSPAVWHDWIFLTALEDGKLETLCYHRRDGKLLWKADAKAKAIEEFNASEGSPAASTPATDGRHVVSYFGSCGLVCYDMKGQELWRYSLPTVQSAGSFGSGSSPVIVDGLAIASRDDVAACSLLAVDVRTGKKAWEITRTDVTPGFGTPIFWKNKGAKEVVMPGSLKLKAYDLKSGAERWSLAGMPSFTCTTPVVGKEMLYFAGWAPGKEPGTAPSWEGMIKPFDKNNDNTVTPDEVTGSQMESFFKGMDFNRDGKITADDLDSMKANMAKGENVLVAVKPGGKGTLTENQVAWKQTRGLPYVPSPLYYRDRVYLVRDGGIVSSFNAKSGHPYYQQERIEAIGSYYASPVAADGRVFMTSLNGRITVLEAGGESPRILHRADFGERIAATPALVDKAVYVRTATALYAFGK